MADPTPRDRIKRRLGFIVYAIDAGTYYEREDDANDLRSGWWPLPGEAAR